MIALLKKDLVTFFSSLTGYIVIGIFMTLNGLFFWVFPGQYNVLDMGYSSMDTLFFLAPWIFLFLVPAITMRSFSDEIKSGTIELLLTRPLTDRQIVVSKYFGSLILVLLSLLPTLIYFISVWKLGSPSGNLDGGAIFGAYLGLFFLGSIYVAIGIFVSSLTDNQIVAFITTVTLCFIIYIGFESIGSIDKFKKSQFLIVSLGIDEHYKSISRGVIDSIDVFYFVFVNITFILLTQLKLESRKW